MYIGGMLNFVAIETYWLKIAALAAALSMECSLARVGLPLVPWAVFQMVPPGWLPRRPDNGARTLSGGLQALRPN
jgi:hypothetical protein